MQRGISLVPIGPSAFDSSQYLKPITQERYTNRPDDGGRKDICNVDKFLLD
jgi:hypothetical protein